MRDYGVDWGSLRTRDGVGMARAVHPPPAGRYVKTFIDAARTARPPPHRQGQ